MNADEDERCMWLVKCSSIRPECESFLLPFGVFLLPVEQFFFLRPEQSLKLDLPGVASISGKCKIFFN